MAEAYCQQTGNRLMRLLGDGNDGAVWETDRPTALKILERGDSYRRERDAYSRLRERDVRNILGFAVPQLVAFDDTFQAVEMTIVFPPMLLDFAKAYVDRPPDFSPEALEERWAEAAEDFGGDWERVRSLLGVLQTYCGIHYYDAKRANIRFAMDEGGEV